MFSPSITTICFYTSANLCQYFSHILPTFICVVQSVTFQRELRFELFTTVITEMMLLTAVSVHVGLQVTPIAARVAAHTADVGLQT